MEGDNRGVASPPHVLRSLWRSGAVSGLWCSRGHILEQVFSDQSHPVGGPWFSSAVWVLSTDSMKVKGLSQEALPAPSPHPAVSGLAAMKH